MAENVVRITLDVDPKGSVRVLQKVKQGVGKLGKSVSAADKKLAGMNRASKSTISMMKQLAVAFGAYKALEAGIRLMRNSINAAGEFESALVDMAKVTDEPLDAIRQKIQAIDPVLGNSTELVQGYYQVISAGVSDPVESLNVLKVAAMTAKVAHVEQADVVKGITKVMAAYAKENVTATQAAEQLLAMEKAGQTSVAELIPYIGELSAKSAALGISQSELGAAFGAVTKLAGNTSEATTQYKALVTSLLKPSEELTKLLVDYGSAQEAIKKIGFEGVMRLISEEADGNASRLSELLGSAEALSSGLSIGVNEFDAYAESLGIVKDRAGKLDKAFQNYTGTYQAVKDKFDNTLHNMFIELGEELLPVVTKKLDEFADWFQENKGDIVTAVETIMDATVTMVDSVVKVVNLFKGEQESLGESMERQHGQLTEYIEYYDNANWFSKMVSGGNAEKAKEDLAKLESQMRLANREINNSQPLLSQFSGNMRVLASDVDTGTSAVRGLIDAEERLARENPVLVEAKFTGDGSSKKHLSDKIFEMGDLIGDFKDDAAEPVTMTADFSDVRMATEEARRAYESMYRDFGLADDRAYRLRVRNIEDEAKKFAKATGDQVTAAEWKQGQLEKLDKDRERAVNRATEKERRAYESMYRDFGLADDRAYELRVRNIKDEAKAFEEATKDKKAVQQWLNKELEKLDKERIRAVMDRDAEILDELDWFVEEQKKAYDEISREVEDELDEFIDENRRASEEAERPWKDFVKNTKSQFEDNLAGSISNTFDALLGDVKYKKFYKDQAREIEGVIDQLKQQKKAHEAGVETTEAQIRAYKAQGKPVDDLIRQMDDQKASVEKINDEIKKQEDAHKDALDGAEEAYDGLWEHIGGGFEDLWKDVLGSFKNLVAKGIAKSLMNALTGGKEGGGIGDILGSIGKWFTGGDKEGAGGTGKSLMGAGKSLLTAGKALWGGAKMLGAKVAGLFGGAGASGAGAGAAGAGAAGAGAGAGAGAAGAGAAGGMSLAGMGAALGPAAIVAGFAAVATGFVKAIGKKSARRQMRRDMGEMDKLREEALAAGDKALAEEYQARLDAYAERFVGGRGLSGYESLAGEYRKKIEGEYDEEGGQLYRWEKDPVAERITKKYGTEIDNIEWSRMAVNMRNEIKKILEGASGESLIEFNAAIASLDSTTFEQKMDALGLTGSALGWTGEATLEMATALGRGDVPWEKIQKYLADAGVADAEVIKTIKAAYDKGKSGLKAVDDLYEALEAEGVDEKVIKSIVADYKADGRIDDMDQLHEALEAQGLDETAIKSIVSRFSGAAGMRSVDELHEALKAEGIDDRATKSIVAQFKDAGGVGSMDDLYSALKARGIDASAIKSVVAKFSGSAGITDVGSLAKALTAEGVDDTAVKTLQAQVAGQPGLRDWPALEDAMVKTGIDVVTIKRIQGQYSGEGNYREFSGMLTGKGVPSSVSRRVVGKVDVPPVKADVNSFNKFKMSADPRDFNNFQMEVGRALGGPLFYAAGGWLSQHPAGGVIAGGSGIRDDVFLGHSYWGMAREYVVNQAATRANRRWLDWINFKGGRIDDLIRSVQGVAGGGYLPVVGMGMPTYEMPRPPAPVTIGGGVREVHHHEQPVTIPITVVTEDGKKIVEKSVTITLAELKRRSGAGDIIIDARGVGETI